ncbi:unnamed protein product [Trifolium pratense]|uniref:Uncharacterized protein n=1 Tax=Trifolium pratense TaxID=57577 RepID=A0ACB0J196_TRIPR|nr:unnamed protein product [Trifolium pratense]
MKKGGEKNIQSSRTEEENSFCLKQEEKNDLEEILGNMKSARVSKGKEPLDTLLDTGSEKLISRTASLPLDQSVFSKASPMPLDDCNLSNEKILSQGPVPRVSTRSSCESHAGFPPPLMPSNGPLPSLTQDQYVSQGQLDESASFIETTKSNTFSTTCMHYPKTIFPPCDLPSPPFITTPPFNPPTISNNKCGPSLTLKPSSNIPNLEDKVLGGPDSDVSGPSVQKPKRKIFKPYWNNDFVTK